MGDANHRHALFGELDHRVEHLLDHLGVQRRGRLVKKHDPRLHAQGSRNRHPLLLAARKLAGILPRLLGNLHLAQEVHRGLFRLALGNLPDPDRSEGAVLEDRQMREQVEVLEAHPDFRADLVDVLQIRRQHRAIDDDLSLLMLFQRIDAADQRRFP
jgi:hypothetical protein